MQIAIMIEVGTEITINKPDCHICNPCLTTHIYITFFVKFPTNQGGTDDNLLARNLGSIDEEGSLRLSR